MTDQPEVTGDDSAARRAALRRLPSIDQLLTQPVVRESIAERGIPPTAITELARQVVANARQSILAGGDPAGVDSIGRKLASDIERLTTPRLAPIINATGVIIHTNLGRSPVSAATAAAMATAATHYVPLELEIETGKRGGRMSEISRLLNLLTGAEATLVVNNNAAAVLLVLSALCAGRRVILSRSQAVEIGGGFRIPDVMAQSGAELIEVGTTNRTYVRDYEAAIDERTAALMTVHWSNFKIVGFTSQPALSDLAGLAQRRGLHLIDDLGSGTLLDTASFGLAHEPTARESLEAGAGVICFSGDKLLGGPQAGIIAGRAELIRQVAAHPLARAVRADKTTLAGLAATLRHYLRDEATSQIPIWRAIAASAEALERRVRDWQPRLGPDTPFHPAETRSTIGGGSLPGETQPSWALELNEDVARSRGMT
ncbi:MAG TPA: L-seryl-tRNA(Sec) selenium transferase, partial [Thermomicrobiaceae bacterium]|nr:L-seryl-tRNA(Sec) selenium transferase [Thermomicrobiaceae bacterium]